MANKPIEPAPLVNLFRNTPSGTANGYDEQWQRALERAYLDRERGVVHSTGSPVVTESPSADGLDASPSPRTRQTAERLFEPFQVPSSPSAPDTTPQGCPPADGQALPKASSRVARPTQHLVGQKCLLMRRPQTANAKEIPVRHDLATRLQGKLPSSSSLKLLLTEQGVHVLIRDTDLDDGDIRRLVRRIRGVLTAANRRLVAMTVNGERVWEDWRVPDDLATVAASEQQIDRLY
jgi:hypothetical protein